MPGTFRLSMSPFCPEKSRTAAGRGLRTGRALGKCGVDVRRDVFAETQHLVQMMAGRAPEADARFADRLRLAA
jgi:hypothetical protein